MSPALLRAEAWSKLDVGVFKDVGGVGRVVEVWKPKTQEEGCT